MNGFGPPARSRRLDVRACDGPSPRRDRADLLAELDWRGILHATTPGLAARLATGRPIAGYIGFDPSAASLHVGHLVPIFGLLRLQRHGGRPVALVGGGTGMIGDPSGRSSERNLLDRDDAARANVAAIAGAARAVPRLLARGRRRADGQQPRLAGAAQPDRLPARHRQALHGRRTCWPRTRSRSGSSRACRSPSSATCSSRRTTSPHLHRTIGRRAPDGRRRPVGQHHRRARAHPADERRWRTTPSRRHGLAYQLLLSPSGTKFGKSETGDSVWLDPARTSPYAFYQYWLNTDDRDVGTYLRWFTEFGREEIEAPRGAGGARAGSGASLQRALALDITVRTHGEAAADAGDRQFRGALRGRARSTIRPRWSGCTRRAAASSSMGRTWRPGWPCCWPMPASSHRAARPAG